MPRNTDIYIYIQIDRQIDIDMDIDIDIDIDTYIYKRTQKKLPKWLRNICTTKKCVFNNFENYRTLLLQQL